MELTAFNGILDSPLDEIFGYIIFEIAMTRLLSGITNIYICKVCYTTSFVWRVIS